MLFREYEISRFDSDKNYPQIRKQTPNQKASQTISIQIPRQEDQYNRFMAELTKPSDFKMESIEKNSRAYKIV